MSNELPPLPEKAEILASHTDHQRLVVVAYGYTADQMRDFARAAVLQEREANAAACEAIADEYQRREGRRFPELKSDANTGAEACAAAIRARSTK